MTDKSPSVDPHPPSAAIGFLDAATCLSMLADGELSSVELTEGLLRRLAEIDGAGPRLSSVLAVDERAQELAAERDAERRSGAPIGSLHGLPVLVKDNIDTAGGLPTTCGSLALADPGCQPIRDAAAVARLRHAGAIVIGKSNLSEWANFRSRHSSSGWSVIGGQCRNPHALDRSPGGSSSGSGAAVAAGLAPLAVGTETDGSILCPASLCGVVGIKPTVGLVGRSGVIPVSRSQDTVGPLARTVADAALLLGVLAGPDPGDPSCAARPADLPEGYMSALSPRALEGARVGVARKGCTGYSTWADAAAGEAIAVMADLGAEIVDPAEIVTAVEMSSSEDEMTVLLHEFKASIDSYLRGRPGTEAACPRDLAALIEFGRAEASELAVFGQDIFESALDTGGLEDLEYLAALERNKRRAGADGIDATLRLHGLDCLVAPTMSPAWLIDHVNGDQDVGASFSPAAVAGYPSVSVPIGDVAGLPLGLCLMGPAWSEAKLIGYAFALEQALALDLRPSWQATVAF